MKQIVSLLCLLFILQLAPQTHADNIEKIIGADDLVAVNAAASNIPFRFRNLVNAFGKMSMGCTATHIGSGYVLTAGHCFWADENIQRNQDCTDETIDWGLREGQKPYLVSKCLKVIIAQRTSRVDYALIKVSPVPNFAISPDLDRAPVVGDRITIFSHPDELPLRWSQLCSLRRTLSNEFSSDVLQHQCDTNPGSSGATIINAATLKVIGIHDGGYANFNGIGTNYGTYLFDTPLIEMLKKAGF